VIHTIIPFEDDQIAQRMPVDHSEAHAILMIAVKRICALSPTPVLDEECANLTGAGGKPKANGAEAPVAKKSAVTLPFPKLLERNGRRKILTLTPNRQKPRKKKSSE
jgi:hypothetical protein